jgi:hypothetical protein
MRQSDILGSDIPWEQSSEFFWFEPNEEESSQLLPDAIPSLGRLAVQHPTHIYGVG